MKLRVFLVLLAACGFAAWGVTAAGSSDTPAGPEAVVVASAVEPSPEPAAPTSEPTPVDAPAEAQAPTVEPAPESAPLPPAPETAPTETLEPAPATLFSRCEIRSFALGGSESWGVAGWTEEPRGTVFTFTLTVDGETQVIPLVARAGSMIFSDGTRYGTPGQYEDSGSTNFGLTSADMPSLALPHGPVSASVTLGDEVICSS